MFRHCSTVDSFVGLSIALALSLASACGPPTSGGGGGDDEDATEETDTGTIADTFEDTAADADSGTDTAPDTQPRDGGDADVQPCSSPQTWYRDEDGDGYGTEDSTTMACSKPEGYVEQSGDCNDSRASANPDGTEMCDGVDNDCDGDTDEGPSGDPLTRDCDKQDGVCSGASITCTNGTYPLCSGDEYGSDYQSTESLCDGLDNDCDGQTDESLTKQCSEQRGVCANSTTSCSNGTFSDCSASDYGSDYESTEMSCDNLDNDCDGQTDESLPEKDCSLQDGVCAGATISCQNGTYPPCGGAEYGSDYEGSDETSCDNLDNDCDGQTDEGVTQNCPKQQGVCAGSSVSCQNGSFPSCTDSDYGPDYESGDETICDGLDNDCDGQTDENLSGCTFNTKISGNPTAAVVDLEVDPNTNDAYLAGMEGDVLKAQRNKTSQDIFVAKYDEDGNQQWKKTISSSGIDTGNSLALDTSNNELYVAGSVEASVAGQSVSGSSDGIVATYDLSGTRTNVELIGTSGADDILSVAIDSKDDRIDVAGYTDGAFTGQSNAGANDAFLLEYDRNWTRQWTVQFGSSSDDYLQGIAVDSSTGNIHLVGTTLGAISSGTTHQGRSDIFTAVYDTSGTRQWIEQSGSSSAEGAYRVAVDESSGAMYAVGSSSGSLQGMTFSGGEDAFVMKRDSSGTFQWIDSTGGSAYDGWQNVRYDPDSGTLFVSGYSDGSPGSTTNNGGYDAMTAEYTTSGTRSRLELRGTSNLDYAVAVGSNSTASDLYIGGVWDYDTVAESGDAFLAKIR